MGDIVCVVGFNWNRWSPGDGNAGGRHGKRGSHFQDLDGWLQGTRDSGERAV